MSSKTKAKPVDRGPHIAFKLTAGTKTYEGTLAVIEDGTDGPATLPMMVNSLMVHLADDCPELHTAREILFTATLHGTP